jgi:hypothetical protein
MTKIVHILLLQITIVCVTRILAVHYEWNRNADKSQEKWINNARQNIHRLLHRKPNGNVAKNIILFLGTVFFMFCRNSSKYFATFRFYFLIVFLGDGMGKI